MSNLPDLPPSKNSFWDGADKHLTDDVVPKKCEHFFERKGYAVECKKCHVGFLLNYPFYVLDGKICVGDEFVV